MVTSVITENTAAQNATADNLYTGVVDNRLEETDAGASKWGSATTIQVAKYGASDHNHTIIRFDGLSNIPSGAVVSAATLYIYQTSADASYDISLRRVLQAWVEANSNWNDYDDPNAWNTGGALGAGTDRTSTAESSTTIAATTSAYYGLDCTSLVQDIIDGTITSDEGFHLERADSGNDSTFKIFASSEGANGQRPELVVVYTTATALDPNLISILHFQRMYIPIPYGEG